MRKEEERKRREKICIEQILGEVVLYIPLILIAIYLDLLLPCTISMLGLFIFKQFFYYGLHLFKWYHCVTLSYSVFIALSLLYYAISVKIPFMQNQPMLLVIACIGLAYLNCRAGVRQLRLAQLSIWHMNEQELRIYCRAHGIIGDRLEFVVSILIKDLSYTQIAKELHYSVETLKDWSVICKSKLNIKSWDITQN